MAVLYRLLGSGVALPGCAASPERRERRMQMSELVIKGATVVDATGTRRADVVVEDGRIVAVGADLRRRPRCWTPRGCVLGPGLVDLHTHLRQPGHEEAETVETGSRAAALGGLHRGGRHAQHRRPPSIRGDGPRGARPRAAPRCATCGWPGRSPSAGRARSWPRSAEMAALGVRLFTDDGRGVQDARLMRRAHGVRLRPRGHPGPALRGRGRRPGRGDARGGVVQPARPARPAGRGRGAHGPAGPGAGAADRRPHPLPAPVHGPVGRPGA